MKIDSKKHISYFSVAILILFVLLITKGLKFSGWGFIPILANIRYLVLFALPIYTIIVYSKVKKKSVMYYKDYSLYIIFICLLTFLIRMLVYGGGWGYGLENNLLVSFVFCCYFVFHKVKISESDIILSLSIIGLVVLAIQIFQQLYPEMAVFSMYTDDMRQELGLSQDYIASMRNGLYRFMPIAQHFPLFLLCYYFSKLLSDYKLKTLLLTIAFAASTYLMLTRMFMICACISCIYIYSKRIGRDPSLFHFSLY